MQLSALKKQRAVKLQGSLHDESMIQRWRQNSFKIDDESSSIIDSKRKRLAGAGRKPVRGDLEEELLEKIIDKREKHYHVACKIITVWAQELATAHNLGDFQASQGWLFNFMRRNNLTVRRRTTTGQTIPKDALQKIASVFKLGRYAKRDNSRITRIEDRPYKIDWT